jgi:DNA-directed RNA polymerase sigma subunit (sigma70/sigma32)
MMTRTKKITKTAVKTQTTTLTALEEKVVRMRHGLRAPDTLVLEQVGQDNSEVTAKLRAIEERAIAMVSARMTPTKRKIVSVLKRKSER